ncbi:MAG TPA: hypothetical protein P5150_03665 [Candidatus Ratteibacteria bacterium]|nr:hypothetical protein [Candidatus Ratteibacteria bacterium]
MKKFFIAILVFFSFIFKCNAATKISVSYKGLDNVHLQYEVEIGYKADEIKIVYGDGEEASIDIGSLPEGGGKLEGTKLHSGLTEGNYTFQLVIDGVNYGSPVSVDINGKIGGTLLYNETIDDVATLEGNVVVPDGKTLTIKNKLIGSASYNSIYVDGTINFQSGAVLNGVNIHFRGEQSVNIDSIGGNGELIFYQKSTGSNIGNCKSKFLITVQPNTLVSINKSEIYGLQLSEESSLSIKDSTVLSEFSISKIKSFEAENTTFLSPISINGRSPKFENCEFADFVTLHNRNEAEFKDCVFGSDLVFDDFSVYDLPKWSEDSSVHPTFSGNSFVGQSGPRFEGLNGPFTPIYLGDDNYYGDKAPVIGNMLRTFLTRGTEINTLHFLVSNWNSSGSEMKNKKKLPSFWVNDYVVGQNCLPHPSPWSGSSCPARR